MYYLASYFLSAAGDALACLLCFYMLSIGRLSKVAWLLLAVNILDFVTNVELMMIHWFTISIVPKSVVPAFQMANRCVVTIDEILCIVILTWLLVIAIRFRDENAGQTGGIPPGKM